ncbi:hypothetical protein POTOM_046605 [Populus tomentosa]|uniref:Uncharacterized protein n=1 Tax=Populus tomentosa TaxID=118781 RepID=A0A8X7YJG1_POPTO|nr:hypothetical protein POTOM_046605 [Populus tomentosa]
MATHSLLRSLAASFHGRFPALPSRLTARAPYGTQNGVISVRTTAEFVLVDKSEADKSIRLKTTYLETIVPLMLQEFSYTNIDQVPRIQKVVVSCGIGDAAQSSKEVESAINDLALITGQRPVKTGAENAVAAFKSREARPLGIYVTLRGNGVVVFDGALRKMILKMDLPGEAAWVETQDDHQYSTVGDLFLFSSMLELVSSLLSFITMMMYSFLDRLVNLGLPRTRDFQGGTPNSFNRQGNYSIGISDQSVFPEINFDAVGKPRGMDVCITTTANTDQEAQRLLSLMGMPFIEGGGAVQPRKKKSKAHHSDSKSKERSRR